jgi:hypothetical protein
MRRKGHGAKFRAATSKKVVERVGAAYVDDSDLITTAPTVETKAEEITEAFQTMLDDWQGYLRATGGAIEADKSFFYSIDHVWKKDKWFYKKMQNSRRTWI